MPSVNGAAAIAWMKAKKTNVAGACLNTVWQAFGSHDSIGPHEGQYPEAIDGWDFAEKRHPGDMNPPPGVPVWFGRSASRHDADAGAGDVVISLGGGQVIGTDVGGAGRIGITTIASRAAAIQRPYLGWTADFLGYDVQFTAAAGGNATPIPAPPVPTIPKLSEEENMLLIKINDGAGHYGAKGLNYSALVIDGHFMPVPEALANQLTYTCGMKQPDGTPTGNSFNLLYPEWEAFKSLPHLPVQ